MEFRPRGGGCGCMGPLRWWCFDAYEFAPLLDLGGSVWEGELIHIDGRVGCPSCSSLVDVLTPRFGKLSCAIVQTASLLFAIVGAAISAIC